MNYTIPSKLQSGDTVMVVAPARSLGIVSQETRDIANQRFAELGLRVVFGRHVEECDVFFSSSIEGRIEDLHEGFSNPEIKAIFTAIGGFSSNQLLSHIDWQLIKNNPKIFCGYSDITALNNTILTKSGLITYSGPHYSSFGEKLYFDYSLEYLKKCLFEEELLQLTPSDTWTDDPWYKNQDDRHPLSTDGYTVLHEGTAEGIIIGGNLCTLNLLQGTEYSPNLSGSILFLEDDSQSDNVTFDRDLQSLIHQPSFSEVQGLVIGRFQKASGISLEQLQYIIDTKKELRNLPIIVNADFGHTSPRFTYPIGGQARIFAGTTPSITITTH